MPTRPSFISDDTWGRFNDLETSTLLEQGIAELKLPELMESGLGNLRSLASSFELEAPSFEPPTMQRRPLMPMVQTPMPEITPVAPPDYRQEFAEYGGGAEVPFGSGTAPTQPRSRVATAAGAPAFSGGKSPEGQAQVYQTAIASGLDDEGARVLAAVTETEGGWGGAVGDQGQSRGIYQFHERGQMPAFRTWLAEQGIQGDPNQLAYDPAIATRFAATTYLGNAVKEGRAQGLSGPDLATFVQRHGQRSVAPETTGANYSRLFGAGAQVGAAPAEETPQAQAQTAQATASFNPGSIAKAYEGVPYVFGGPGGRSDPRLGVASDCSGFVSAVFKNVYGVDLPAHTDASYNRLRGLGAPEIAQKDARPGDVVYYMGAGTGGAITHHMGIYAGDGKVLDMSTSGGGGVRTRDVGHAGKFVILRDPRVNPQPARSASVPPPIVETGIAEQTGGEKLSNREITTLAQNADPLTAARATTGAGPMMLRGPLAQQPADMPLDGGSAPAQSPGDAPGQIANPVYGPPLSEAGPEQVPPSGQDDPGTQVTAPLQIGDISITNGGPPTPGGVWQEMETRPLPRPEPPVAAAPQIQQQAMPSIPGLQPVLDAAGKVVAWVQSQQQEAATPSEPITPPPSPYAAGQAESMEPAPGRFESRPGYGQVVASPGEPDYVDAGPQTVTQQIGSAIQEQRQPGGLLEPAGGAPRILGRMNEIAEQASREMGVTDPNEWLTRRAVKDPAWRARNPSLAAEYDQLEMQAGLTIVGQAGDAARVSRLGQGAGEAAQGMAQIGPAIGREGAPPPPREPPFGAPSSGAPESSGPIRRSPPTIDDGPLPAGPRALPEPPGRTTDDLIVAAHNAVGVPERASVLEPGRLERLRRSFVRAWTDNRVDLSEAQNEARRLLGRPLTGEEMVYEASRVNPSGAAKVAIDEYVRPLLTDLDSSAPVVSVADSAGRSVDLTEVQVLARLRELVNNRDVATVLGNADRRFSGGLTGAESEAAARALLEKLPRETQIKIGQANNAITDIVDRYRERLVDAGVWSRELGDQLKEQYPNWVPTKILDYMRDEGQPGASAIRTIGLSNRHLHRYLFEGTNRKREDGIASLIRYIQQAEDDIAKNRTFNAFYALRERVPGWQGIIREVKADTPVESMRGEQAVTGWVDGERRRFIVPAPLSAAIQMEQPSSVPIISTVTRAFRELITRSPAFIAGQIPLDAFSTLIRESAREGGPQHAPRVAAAIVGGYREAFRGLFDGTFHGNTARYLQEGGGMAGFYERSAQSASRALDDVSRRSMIQIRTSSDLAKTLKWLALQEPTVAVGQRVELAPRTASFQLGRERAIRRGMAEGGDSAALVPAEQAGARASVPPPGRTTVGVDERRANLEAMTGARDVTLDFQRGGTVARLINQMVPFFNVGVQSSTTPWRSFREAPAGYATAVTGLIGAPMVAVEAWNRSDAQRAQDYADVPDYVKDRGIVIMTGTDWTDKNGERRPQYVLIPTRELSPFVILGRELAGRTMGALGIGSDIEPRAWGELLASSTEAASPIQATGPADLLSTATPYGLSTGLQLAVGHDFFRDRRIATDRADREAGVVARAASDLSQEAIGSGRPSEWEFGLRDMTGNLGAAALAGADIVANLLGAVPEGAEPRSLEATPVSASVTKRFVGDATGGNLERARDAMMTPELRESLRAAGLRDDQITPVRSEVDGIPLTRAEQTDFQTLFNEYLGDEIGRAEGRSTWGEEAARTAMERARQRASRDILRSIPVGERRDRKERAGVR